MLFSWLPSRFKLREISKVFSTKKNGFNLNTLISKVGKNDPTLLLIKTDANKVIGNYYFD